MVQKKNVLLAASMALVLLKVRVSCHPTYMSPYLRSDVGYGKFVAELNVNGRVVVASTKMGWREREREKKKKKKKKLALRKFPSRNFH